MPYEATVPVHRRLLWPAVIDPERLLGALPNAVLDASGNQGVAGRLRVRMRDQTVTFRGIARIVEVVPTSLRVAIEVEATFGRSGGAVEGIVEITLRASGSGTRAVVTGNLSLADESSPLPSAETVDAALSRIVRRWFTTLAESSPAAMKPEPPETPPAKAEPPRAAERTPLAVVEDEEDEAVGEKEEEAAAGDETAQGDGEAEAEPVEPPVTKPALSIPPMLKPAAAKSGTPQVQLRLVSSREDVPPQDDEPAETAAAGNGRPWIHAADRDDEPEQPGIPPEQSPDADVDAELGPDLLDAGLVGPEFPDTGEDIWSRLRDRGLPRWIPVVLSGVLAALGSAVLVIVALRRHYRRHHG